MHNSKRLYVLCFSISIADIFCILCKDRVKMFKTNISFVYYFWLSCGKICIQYARHLVCIIIVCCQLWMWDEFTDIVFVRLFSLFGFFFHICFAFGYFIMYQQAAETNQNFDDTVKKKIVFNSVFDKI